MVEYKWAFMQITQHVESGVFSPITSDGTLVVNGVHCSCFAEFEDHTIQVNQHFLTVNDELITDQKMPNSVSNGRASAADKIPMSNDV